MENEIKTFTNTEFGELNILVENDKPLFPASECAKILGYAIPRKAIIDHCKGVLKRNTLTNGGLQEINYIPEGDLYRLIIKSRLPEADKFESWIFDEVLPSIRKYGAYMTPEIIEKTIADPDFIIGIATELKKEQMARLAAEKQVQALKPKADLAVRFTESKNSILIRDYAKVLSKDGYNTGEKRLFNYLRESKILTENNLPYQRFVDAKYFEVIERPVETYEGTILNFTTKITPKGQAYIFNRLKREGKIAIN
jgi:anti-repressor protein